MSAILALFFILLVRSSVIVVHFVLHLIKNMKEVEKLAVLKTVIKMKNALDPRQQVGDVQEFQFLSGFEVIVSSFNDNFEEFGFEKGVYLIEISGRMYRIMDDCLVYIDCLQKENQSHQTIANAPDGNVFVMNNSGVYKKLLHADIVDMISPNHLYPFVPDVALVENGKVHPYFKYGRE